MKYILRGLVLLMFCGFAFGYVAIPNQAYAEGIVPCGDAGDAHLECSLCDLQNLAVNFVKFMITFATMVATLLFVNAGILYVFSPASPGNIAKAHKIFMSTLVGFILILAAWLIISIIMSTLYKASFGTWSNILCGEGPDIPTPPPSPGPSPGPVVVNQVKATGPGYTSDDLVTKPAYPGPVLSDSALAEGLDNLTNNCTVSGGGSCADYIKQQAIAEGIDPNYALALAAIESGGCSNPATCQSGVGAVGVIQLMPGTARDVCGITCSNMSDAQVTEYLKNPTNNIELGVDYMAQSSDYVDAQMRAHPERFDADRKNDYMAAYYNGGPAALEASNDCGSSMTKYECGINPGGYTETQTYVEKMNTYVNSVDSGTNLISSN